MWISSTVACYYGHIWICWVITREQDANVPKDPKPLPDVVHSEAEKITHSMRILQTQVDMYSSLIKHIYAGRLALWKAPFNV